MRNDDQISNLIVGLLLEFKQIIISKDEKYLILENLLKGVDDYKTSFTNMKNVNMINLRELSKITHKKSNKRKKYIYEQSTKFPENKFINIKQKSEIMLIL